MIENHRLGGTAFRSRGWVVGLLVLSMGCQTPAPPARPSAAADPLASWNDNTTKRSIIDFVQLVTTPGGPSFVPVPERIAVFDNDGTLWAEQPIYFQLAFAIDRVKALAPQHPEWTSKQPFKSVLAGDIKGALDSGDHAALAILAAAHAGMTSDEFTAIVGEWIASARHPRFDHPYDECVYQPMLDLLGYLRTNGFKTYIVSGGGVDFIRAWTEKSYGIPPEQVVGSMIGLEFEMRDSIAVLVREPKIDFVDDGPGKPVGIQRFIGRRPIFAFGNSDGDQQMLEWTASGDGPHFMGLVHHTDADREWAYDRGSPIGRLDKALDEATRRGWTVVDMKLDWKQVFPFESH